MEGRVYRIGELSSETGLTSDALRYYERLGLLDRPARTTGGFRVYGSSAVQRIRFIKRAQALGFSLGEIRQLLGFNGKGGLRRCARVRDLLRSRLAKIEAMLSDLGLLQETLRAALDQCEHALATRDASSCPIIDLGRAPEERPTRSRHGT